VAELASHLAELSGRGHGEEEQGVAKADARWIQGEARAAELRGSANGAVAPRLALLRLRASGKGKAREMASEGGSSGSTGRVKAKSGLRGPPGATRTPSTASGGHVAAVPCSRSGKCGRGRGRARLMVRIGGARPTKEYNFFLLFFSINQHKNMQF
jgi:hypothetical protein